MFSLHTLAVKYCFIALVSFCSYTIVFAQQDSLNNNFNEGMGIWAQGLNANLVNTGPSEAEKWLMLQKGIGQNNSEFQSANPHITSVPIDLTDYCAVDISFDMMALRTGEDTEVFLEVSHDGGQTFQLLREASEVHTLRSGSSFVQAQQQKFNFPVRSFITNSMVFRLNTVNMTDQSQIFIDNIKFEGQPSEDNLLAIWQMGSLSDLDQDKFSALDNHGNCVGIEALPLQISDSSDNSHFDVEGFSQNFLPEENLSNLASAQNNGALCFELSSDGNKSLGSLSFSLNLTPEVRGQVSGFEFMEQATATFRGEPNNYPTQFDLKIFKGEKLIFNQINIATSQQWSDRIFRLSHIQELQVTNPETFTFELTPTSRIDNGADLSVWFIDEVKVLGGCCEVDCDLVEVDVDHEYTDDGIILTPVIDAGADICIPECVGNITNQGSEEVSVDNDALGWSYFNAAETVSREEALLSLPENFEEQSFDLVSGLGVPSRIETEVINLCPGSTYAVCFDHIGQSLGSDTTLPVVSFTIDGSKQKDIPVNTDLTRTCMSFVATSDHHRIALSSQEGISRQQPSHNYVDNITVDALSVGEPQPVGVVWGKSELFPINVTTASLNRSYQFRLQNVIDTTETFNDAVLYSMCFDVAYEPSSGNAESLESVKVSIGSDVRSTFDKVSYGDRLCANFLTSERTHLLRFEAFGANGLQLDVAPVGFSNIHFNTFPLRVTDNTDESVLWTKPDGSVSKDYELLAEEEGDYILDFENCNACVITNVFSVEYDKRVCPSAQVVSCEESFNPEVNRNLALRQPERPFSIGESHYEDAFTGGPCITNIERRWTVERLMFGDIYDTITCLQLIEVVDSEGPVFVGLSDDTFNCVDAVPEPVRPQVFDNCSEGAMVVSEDIERGGSGCANNPILISRYWTATDACGNVTTAIQNFEIIHDGPSIVCPPSLQVDCHEEIAPSEPEITLTCDDLDVRYFTNLSLVAGNSGCQGAVYEMTYTVIDACERSVSCVQNFEITGQVLEVTCPAGETLQCLDEFNHGVPTYVSTCNAAVTIHNFAPQLVVGNALCTGAIYEVLYEVVDTCGLSASCAQEIQIENSGMSMVCPLPQIVTCPDDIMAGVPLISEACGLTTYYESTEPNLISGSPECSGAVYQIRYTAYDLCDNALTCLQSFTIQNVGLSIVCPANRTVACKEDIASEVPEIFSFCDTNPVFVVSNAVAIGSSLSCSGEVYALTYTGSDNCGNVEVCKQNFEIQNVGLTINCPPNTTVNCLAEIQQGQLSVSSSCAVGYVENVSEPQLLAGTGGCDGAVYALTYEVSDDCGNVKSCVQEVSLSNFGLSLTCPLDTVVTNFESVIPDPPLVVQTCGLNYSVVSTDPLITNVSCGQVEHIITYTAEGFCGAVLSCDQYITVSDDDNAIDANFVCEHSSYFLNLDCDQGGKSDALECSEGNNPEDPCDDVSFDLVVVDAVCYGEASGVIKIIVTSGNPPYEYSLDNQNWTVATEFNNLVAGDYTVYIRTTNGPQCDFQFSEVISEPTLTPAEAGEDQEICIGYEATLTASGGATYLWSTGESSTSIVVSPLKTTVYTVTVTQADGCHNEDSVEVVVNENNGADAGDDLEICVGDLVFLEATGGQSFLWSNGNQTAGILSAPNVTTTYTVTVTDENGCTDTDAVVVTVDENTTSAITNGVEICVGESAELVASGGISYLWNTGYAASVYNVAPVVTTAYQVTVTDENGCTKELVTSIIVNENESADAGLDTSICVGEITTLTASGGLFYLWSSNENTNSISVSPTQTTTYTVTVTDINGCIDEDEVTVEVFELPEAGITGDAALCLNETIELVASGGVSYVWSEGSTTAAIFVSPTASTSYEVSVTDANGCMSTAAHSVVVNENTTSAISPNAELCYGEQVDLTASGGVTYVWSTGETTATINVTPTTTTIYSVIVTDTNGCTALEESTVIVHPLPQADAGADSSLCIGETTTLSVSGGTTYEWSTGATTQEITITPTQTTTYTVTVTDINGCTDEDEVTVEVFELPEASIEGESEICAQEEIELTAEGGISYVWSNGATTDNIFVTPLQNTNYLVTITDVNGCTSTASHTVVVHTNTSSSINANEEICEGGQVDLMASGGVSYLWSTGEVTSDVTVAPLSTTTYFVTVTDENGCTAVEESTVVVHLLPAADAGADGSLCIGESYTLMATGGGSYLWSTGETSSEISVAPTVASTYAVTVTDSNGCIASDEVTLTVYDLPLPTITEEQTICEGETVNLEVGGGSTYLWSTQETSSIISVMPQVTTTYSVTVTDNNGCSDSVSVEVIVDELPEANAGEDQDICVGDDATLTATGGVSYLWSTEETSATIVVDPFSNSDYQVTVTASNGCTAIDDVTVFVHDYPDADAGGFVLTCYGEPVTLTATGGTNYVWSSGDTTASITITPLVDVFYEVTVSDDFGCSSIAEVDVILQEQPYADAGDDQIICVGSSVQLFGGYGDTYLWTPNLFLDDNTAQAPVSNPDNTITYTLIVTDEQGCTASDDVTITIEQNDVEPPVALCSDITVVVDSNGEVVITPGQVDNNSTDNCGIVQYELDETEFSCLLIDYTIVLTVSDAAGNDDSCTSTVTLTGPDYDCDLMANGCDLCAGGDDTIDNNNDGLPDCAFPPPSYEDVEDLWKCGVVNGVQMVWVCHAPFQSICTEYDSVYLHTSFHQDDYLGPCFAIGCFFDAQTPEDMPDHQVTESHSHHTHHAHSDIELSCKTVISDIHCGDKHLIEKIKNTLEVVHMHCSDYELTLSYAETELSQAICRQDEVTVTFQVTDICGHQEQCLSTIILEDQRIHLYPNPATDLLYIEGLNGEHYSVFGVEGRLMMSQQREASLKLNRLEAGVYFIVTASGRTERFIITK